MTNLVFSCWPLVDNGLNQVDLSWDNQGKKLPPRGHEEWFFLDAQRFQLLRQA